MTGELDQKLRSALSAYLVKQMRINVSVVHMLEDLAIEKPVSRERVATATEALDGLFDDLDEILRALYPEEAE